MDTLPPELLLYFIPFLPLTSLIAARGVNAQWRFFAQTAPLHPTRKVLLNIYLATIIHPNFPSVVAALQHGLREFNREAYIADLTSQGCVLPDLFELWILEWPTKAVHFWAWPGLPWWPRMEDEYFEHTNFMYEAKCTTETIPVPKKEVATVGSPTCRGLLLWSIFLPARKWRPSYGSLWMATTRSTTGGWGGYFGPTRVLIPVLNSSGQRFFRVPLLRTLG